MVNKQGPGIRYYLCPIGFELPAIIFLPCLLLSSSTTCKSPIFSSEIKYPILTPSHFLLCPKCLLEHYDSLPLEFSCLCGFPLGLYYNLNFSLVNLSLLIGRLAQLEQLRRWEEKYYFFLASTHMISHVDRNNLRS